MKTAILHKMIPALGLAALALGFQVARAANYLEDIGVARDGDSVVVTITTTQAGEYKAFLTDDKPERIVVDLYDVTNSWTQTEFRSLPLRSIKSIRTSQFKASPDLEARVVLDIERPIEFTSHAEANNIIIKMPAAPDETQFTMWQAQGPLTQERAVAPAAQEEKEAPEPQAEIEPEPLPETEPVTDAELESDSATEEPESTELSEATAADSTLPSTSIAVVAPPGVQVETTPKRKVIEYTTGGIRDPFAPLLGSGGAVIEGLPSLENLKLVGILEDAAGNRALLEDAEGNGYMLKANDRIRNGYVVSVTDNKAIFQVTEYGWTRSVALELQLPEIK